MSQRELHHQKVTPAWMAVQESCRQPYSWRDSLPGSLADSSPLFSICGCDPSQFQELSEAIELFTFQAY